MPFPPSPLTRPPLPAPNNTRLQRRANANEHGPGGQLRRSLRRQRLEWRRAQAANHAGTKRTTNTGNKEKRTARVGREDEKLLREAASKGNEYRRFSFRKPPAPLFPAARRRVVLDACFVKKALKMARLKGKAPSLYTRERLGVREARRTIITLDDH